MKQVTKINQKLTKFFNGSLQMDTEKHLMADEIKITKEDVENDGEDMYYLDINDTGYFYYDLSQRDFDYVMAKSLFTKLSEHPQTTDTGNTVSSEVGFTGGEWNMYISEKGKDGCSRAYINSALPNDMYETICTMAGLNGTEPGEQAKANAQRIVQAVNNHDNLVSALKRLLPFVTDNVSGDLMELVNDTPQNAMDAAKELLNNIKVTK